MVTIDYFPNIPDSKLKRHFVEKASEHTESSQKLFLSLDEFQRRVSNEIQFIRETFPEFTPHEEKHHLIPLFKIADKIIDKGYQNFTFPELYLLIVGIWGHDWGMVVSKEDRRYILNQQLPESSFEGNQDILRQDRVAFLKFVTDEGLMTNADNDYENLSNALWQKFVRNTHAQRSSYRVKSFFQEKNDFGIAEIAGKICLGHTLEFRDLEKDDDYPKIESVFGEIVNVKAITLYLRIIDLFDISNTRTPHDIFNFLFPISEESIRHWKKHFPIDPIAVQSFSGRGRQILVRGRTNDPEIYADLEDLKNLCKHQLDRTGKIFSLMNDPRHNFDIIYLDWNIKPEDFKGISIKFEFERTEMFNILSSEIYQRDPLVFLRELLQNSIDAIRLKKELGKQPDFLGFIKVDIENLNDNTIRVTWYDNGIGMDEYIVKNYLAVIGRSFYERSNLQKLGIKLDPISKFGIGILSCFYVGKDIEIRTYKDNKISPGSIPLEIKIPQVNRHFRIRELCQDSIKQGTEITIHIENSKISRDDEVKDSLNAIFTEYLEEIAGFVEFPIIIDENGKSTIIHHPNPNLIADTIVKDYPNHSIEKICYEYPFDSIFLPNDVEYAKKIFSSQTLNLRSDLQLDDFEGAISFLTLPKDREWIRGFFRHVGSHEVKGLHIVVPKGLRYSDQEVRWFDLRTNRFNRKIPAFSPLYRLIVGTIFKDGILLRNEENPLFSYEYHRRSLPPPIMYVNILHNDSSEINLARTNLLGEKNHWSNIIEAAISNYILANGILPLHIKNKKERWYQIGRTLADYPVSSVDLADRVSNKKIPILSLEKGGNIKFFDIGGIRRRFIRSIPEEIVDDLGQLLANDIIEDKPYRGLLKKWCGEPCFGIGDRSNHYLFESIDEAYSFSSRIFEKDYICSEIVFLHPYYSPSPPLKQKIYRKFANWTMVPTKTLLKKASMTPHLLSLSEIYQLNQCREWRYTLHMPEIYDFLKGFSSYFAFGWEEMNVNHPISQKIIQIAAKLILYDLDHVGKVIYWEIKERLSRLSDIEANDEEDPLSDASNVEIEAKKLLFEVFELFIELDFISNEEVEKISTTQDLFIPLSFLHFPIKPPEKLLEYQFDPHFGLSY